MMASRGVIAAARRNDLDRRVGLVVRVSTERQAQNDEGSLTNQRQLLCQHIQYKREVSGENWEEVSLYELRAISGKDSLRSREMRVLFDDIRDGRVNTILCTPLDRIGRSTKDAIHFIEFLGEQGVEFVCLRQNFDTTTPSGKLLFTISAALAEHEREQTGERTREAALARAERGLWNGGQILGYDLYPEREGYLVPNEEEAAVVEFAFETYLDCGSIAETARRLNHNGFRTKSYTSRRGREHPGRDFRLTAVQHLLKNPVYIGKRRVPGSGSEDGGSVRLVEAVWDPIVEARVFDQVQKLMRQNARSNRNGAKPIRHVYSISGLLCCGRCGTAMHGASGNGHQGSKYHYYVCRSKDCRLRISAPEIESVILKRLSFLGSDDEMIDQLVDETNKRLRLKLPTLKKRQRVLREQADELKKSSERLLLEWANDANGPTKEAVGELVKDLARRRDDLQVGIAEAASAIAEVQQSVATESAVREALQTFSEVYGYLKPYEQKELMQLLLHSVEITD